MASVLLFALYRLLTALPVLRWPLAGALIAILGDLGDLFLLQYVGEEWDYQSLDKYFDLLYLGAFLLVALRWQGLERSITCALLALRLVGFVTFEATGWRPVLMVLPNVFEFWFLAVVGLKHYRPAWQWTPRRVVLWLSVLTLVKLGQEYLLHVWRPLDQYTVTEFLSKLWRVLTPA